MTNEKCSKGEKNELNTSVRNSGENYTITFSGAFWGHNNIRSSIYFAVEGVDRVTLSGARSAVGTNHISSLDRKFQRR